MLLAHSNLLALCAVILQSAEALTLGSLAPETALTYSLHVPSPTPAPSIQPSNSVVDQIQQQQQSEPTPTLAKRWREVVVPRPNTKKSDPPPEPWRRTISSSIVEIVHPTVIAGVTFSAKPTSINGPTPWVSLNKQGVPQTVKPKVKNGVTKNAGPDYKNWFKTATTVVHDNKDLKAHNLKEDETFTEVTYIEEDDTYLKMNPLIRCTPDRYLNKGLAKDTSSEPFCTPAENSNIDLGKTYFITWYTRFFEEAEKVKIHLAYVREKEHVKGMRKRDGNLASNYEIVPLNEETIQNNLNLTKRANDAFIPSGTKLAFFSSDWLINRDGYFPLEIEEAWLKGKYSKQAIINIQPDTIDDDDFDLLSQGILVNLRKGTAVYKKSKEQLALEDEGIGEDENKYIVMMTMPTVVCIAACIMYFITQLCSKDRDVAGIRRSYYKSKFHKKLGKPKFFSSKKNKGYANLPQYEEHELDSFKQQ